MQKQKGPVLKSKFGKQLGFNNPAVAKSDGKSNKQSVGFDPARFKTQHKG